MGKKRVFTQEELNEFKSMTQGEYTKGQVKERFDISDSKVETMCRELGIKPIWVHLCKCVVCGKEFKVPHKTVICPECKATPSVCVICGKKFNRTQPYTQKTCSPKCRGIYRKESGIAKAGAQKMKETKLDRYGTLDPTEVVKQKKGGELDPKTCPLCGNQFIPSTSHQVYCTDTHYVPCPVCGKMTELKDVSAGPQACSEECRLKRIQLTSLKRYGATNFFGSEIGKQTIREANIAKYGVANYMQTEEGQEKVRQTLIEKYGVSSPMQSDEVKEKAKETNIERYGVEHYSMTDEFKTQYRGTMETKYGGIGLGSDEIRKKIVSTNNEKYGADFAVSSLEVREKIAASIRDNYGVDNFWQSKEDLARRIKDPTKIDEYYAFKNDPKGYVESHYDYKPSVSTLANDIGVTDTPVYDILLSNKCPDITDRTKQSAMESEVEHFLREIAPHTEVIANCRRVITPQEIDFFLPEYHFGIECNPTVTHNSSRPAWNSDDCQPLLSTYHQIKSVLAEEKGVFLFHIFGYEWTHKRDIIKSMIRNILKVNERKVYARNTVVKEIDSKTCSTFLDVNHRQGHSNAPIRLGLEDKQTGELLSVMTFGNIRPGIGKTVSDGPNDYELVRFCNTLNTSVVGSASKLFKYFLSNFHPNKVISFSDVAHTRGTLYEHLGFTRVNTSSPSYVWVKPYGDEYRNRVSCQKSNLVKMFDDVDEETIKEKSERQIMIDHKYVQVYDSGTIRWEYTATT